MPPERTSFSESASTTKKKLPACDYCKARRVLCHPQPEGRSCPRCLEKGVTCTTTPVVRRKRRPRHVVAAEKETANATRNLDMNANLDTAIPIHNETPSHTAVEKANSVRSDDAISIFSPQTLDARMTSASPSSSTTNSMSYPHTFSLLEQPRSNSTSLPPSGSRIQLPPHLVQDLFNAFMHTSFIYHPIIPYDRLRAHLAGCGWQMSFLPPQERVLVQCIQAITAIISTDPFIVGPEPLPSECQDILTTLKPMKTIKADLREVGRRRETVCQQLRVEALGQAQSEGVATTLSQENAASCYLLDVLENQYDGSNVYASAFAWQVRSLAESWCRHPQSASTLFGTKDLTARWRSFIMADALNSLALDRPLSFSVHDERLLCGYDGLSLERLNSLLKKGCNMGQFFNYLPSVFFQMTRLARETYENLTGAYARRYPIDRNTLTKHYDSLNMLREVCENYTAQAAQLVLNQSKRSIFALESCSSAVSMGWTSLVLYLYKSLKSRLEESAITNSYANSDPDDMDRMDEQTSQSDSRMAALESMFSEVRILACKAAIVFSKAIEDLPLLTRLTHVKLAGGNLKKWAHFLMDADAKTIPAVEVAQTLQRLREALKLAGFAWVDYSDLVEAIDSQIYTLTVDSVPQTTTSQQSMPISMYDSLFSDFGPMGWNMNSYTMDLGSTSAPHFQHSTSFS